MSSNVLPLHFAPSQASSSQNLNVDSYLQYCEVDSLKPSKSESSLKVYLDGTQIKSASNQSNVLVEFEFHDGSKIEIKEISVGIIQFNKFEIIPKGKNHLQYL